MAEYNPKPGEPVLSVDWDRVDFVKVTLEKPYLGGGLRWRHSTSDPKKNMSFNAHDSSSGPVFWPGTPIMYPEDAPAVAGDDERDSFMMPLQAAMDCFGFWAAPLEVPKNGLVGLTHSVEKTRVANQWSWYKMPPGDGTMRPPMNRIGSPDIPHVAIRPLTKAMRPMKNTKGEEIVIRPRAYYDFDNPNMYEKSPETKSVRAAHDEVASLLQGFTPEEVDALRELVRARKNGEQKSVEVKR